MMKQQTHHNMTLTTSTNPFQDIQISQVTSLIQLNKLDERQMFCMQSGPTTSEALLF